jgi:2-amino-4-hydroxy-6-hydroxymethyldihydropteridine diphosphokinase
MTLHNPHAAEAETGALPHRIYIGFGANLGDREAAFRDAISALEAVPEIVVEAVSRLYETEPVGLVDAGPPFLNAAISCRTSLTAHELIHVMQDIERRLGKSPSHRSDLSRHADLDLLLYDQDCVATLDLLVPHPRMHTRAFVLIPLREVASEVMHPVLGETIARLADTLPEEEKSQVRLHEA